MDQTIADDLGRALELLRAGNQKAARAILVEILRVDSDTEQAWYLLSFTLGDPNRRTYALEQVLRINPENQKAKDRLAKVRSAGDAPAGATPTRADEEDEVIGAKEGDALLEQRLMGIDKQGETEPEIPATTPEDEAGKPVPAFVDEEEPTAEPELEETMSDGPKRSRGRTGACVLVTVLLIVILAAGAAVSYLNRDALLGLVAGSVFAVGQQPTHTPTEGVRQLPPTWTPQPSPTALPTSTPRSTSTPTPTPGPLPLSQEVQDEMAVIRQQVADLRGLEILGEVENFILSGTSVEQFLRQTYLTEALVDRLEDERRVLVALGLIKPTYDLVNMELNSRSGNIAGFYLPEDKEVYLIGVGFGGVQKNIYSHEFTHALVDQHYDLSSLGAFPGCEGAKQACQASRALIEGDATLLQTQWFFQYASPQDVEEISRYQPPQQLIPDMFPPPYAIPELSFPYVQGGAFVEALHDRGSWAEVNRAYENPPTTTEQIMHPEKYFAGEDALLVADPLLLDTLDQGWRILKSESLGEWTTYLLLGFGADNAAALDDFEAAEAAAGWGGDQYQVYFNDNLDQTILVAHWVWDTNVDADQFWEAISAYQFNRFRGNAINGPASGICFGFNQQVSCLFRTSREVLWVYVPDEALAGEIVELFPDFQ